MNQPFDVIRARSEAVDLHDRVISALFRYRDEWKALVSSDDRPRTPCDDALLTTVSELFERDPELRTLLQELPEALGGGGLLHTLFGDLFDGRSRPVLRTMPGRALKPLTTREVEVLQELAKGRQYKEIASQLDVSEATIRTHVGRIHQKLGVGNSHEAVNKARALGLNGFTLPDLAQPLRADYTVDLDPMMIQVLGRLRGCPSPAVRAETKCLAALGALLLVIAGADAGVRYERPEAGSLAGKGVIFQYSADGELIRRMDGDGCLSLVGDLIVVPPQGEHEGFGPGNLIGITRGSYSDGLNGSCLFELTPDGSCVRCFAGGRHYSTHFTTITGMAFSRGGALLVSTPDCDAIVEFTEAGSCVRRLAPVIPYGGIAVARNGQIYVSAGWALDRAVFILDGAGRRQHRLEHGEIPVPGRICLDRDGFLYVSAHDGALIQVYNPAGEPVGRIADPCLKQARRLTTGPHHRLYVREADARTIHAFDTRTRSRVYSITGPEGYWILGLCVAPSGHFFVSGIENADLPLALVESE